MSSLTDEEVKARADENPRRRKRKVKDLTGLVVNELTVVSRADDYVNPSGNRFVQWNCRCSCGKMCVKRGTALTSGTAKSCGHLRSTSNRGKNLIDLTGKQFGRWTVLSRAEDYVDPRGKKWPMWLCQCECGTVKPVSGASLRAGESLSCGCYKIDVLSVDRDLVGQEFGRLTVLRKAESVQMYGRNNKMWECVCSCGNIVTVREPDLLGGQVKSCGCLGSSASEAFFEELLVERGVKYETQKTYEGLVGDTGRALRYDFCLDLGRDVLVELNGAQHYRPVTYFGGVDDFEYQTINYMKKRAFAAEHDLLLFEVDCSDRPSKTVLARRLDEIIKTVVEDGVSQSVMFTNGLALEQLSVRFGEDDVARCPLVRQEVYHIKSRNMFIAVLPGIEHGWHWDGEDGKPFAPCEYSGIRKSDSGLRQAMRSADANFVVFWDKELLDLNLWLAMGTPDAKDWERSYSWLSARAVGPIVKPHAWRPCSTHARVAKHYQHEVFYRRELDMWSDGTFINKRSDKRRLVGAYLANRYKYIGKLPSELTDLEILRGLGVAGLVHGYTSYNTNRLAEFLETHRDVKSVIDPCAGWGERMLCCCAHNVKYSGVDVNVALKSGYDHMVSELGLVGTTMRYEDASECDYDAADAVITCPPYRGIEKYSDNGAENLTDVGFDAWWNEVVERVTKSGCKYFCITTNQRCKSTFCEAIEKHGFALAEEWDVNKNAASHFLRKPGGVSTKKEYEQFLVFVRQ